jgi:hypothetical protein
LTLLTTASACTTVAMPSAAKVSHRGERVRMLLSYHAVLCSLLGTATHRPSVGVVPMVLGMLLGRPRTSANVVEPHFAVSLTSAPDRFSMTGYGSVCVYGLRNIPEGFRNTRHLPWERHSKTV